MVTQEELQNMSPEQIMQMQKQQCIFCGMIAGKMAAKKIYEDDEFVVILDIRPANAGHALLIPKEHYNVMPQLPPEIIDKMGIVAKGLSNAMLKGLGAKGTTLFIANGMPAGQRASHFMMHIIPRFEADGIGLEIPERAMKDEDLVMMQQKIIPFVNKVFGIEMNTAVKTKDESAQTTETKSTRKQEGEAEKKQEEQVSDENALMAALTGNVGSEKSTEECEDNKSEESIEEDDAEDEVSEENSSDNEAETEDAVKDAKDKEVNNEETVEKSDKKSVDLDEIANLLK